MKKEIKIIQPKTIIPEGMDVYRKNLAKNLEEQYNFDNVIPFVPNPKHLDNLISNILVGSASVLGEGISLYQIQNAVQSGNYKEALIYCGVATIAGISAVIQGSKILNNPLVHSYVSKIKEKLRIPFDSTYDSTIIKLNKTSK
jgi:hypothetical protein